MGPETKTILVHRNKTLISAVNNNSPPTLTKNSNNFVSNTGQILESTKEDQPQIVDTEAYHDHSHSTIGTDHTFKREVVWFNAIGFLALHLAGLVGLAVMGLGYAYPLTIAYFVVLTFLSGMGITMGAHRLFSHRAYKAKIWLRVTLLLLHTMAGQNCLYVWVRDHRQHHKYSDTDADPHNATRGFFFSHVGWLMSKKHPKVIEYGQKIDMSDLEADAWVMFQKKHYKVLYTIFTLLLPTALPCILWGETPLTSLFATYFARYIVQLNFTWSVNSAAHMFGNKPYDKKILSAESKFVSIVAGGEGWHNYHHTFPWDYRTAELGMPFNLTTKIIDWLAEHGAVYDRKTVTESTLRSRIQRTGDGSHHLYGELAMTSEAVRLQFDNDTESNTNNNVIRRYIVEKTPINNLMTVQVEQLKLLKKRTDDVNNNESSNESAKIYFNNILSRTTTREKIPFNI